MTDLPLDHVLLALVTLAVLAAAAGWMVEKDRPALALALRRSGYLGMLAAGLLLIGEMARQAERSDAAMLLNERPSLSVEGSQTVIPLAGDGHYWTRAEINGTRLDFLIDTGATYTALSESAARAAGLKPDPLRPPAQLDTANGTVEARYATIDQLSFGTIAARRLDAVILPDAGLQTNVIGMNLLSGLESWRVEDGNLILEPKGPTLAD